MIETIHKFEGLNAIQTDKLPEILMRYWNYEPVEDDPDLFVREVGVYRQHLVWNSEGYWELEFLGGNLDMEVRKEAFEKLMLPALECLLEDLASPTEGGKL